MSVLVGAAWGCETVETKKSARKPWEIEDGLWERIEPLLPVVERNQRRPGRKRLDNRKVMCGILFVLYTGIRWEFLPQELGLGSGMTCWRRLRDWNKAGVWRRLHELLLAELRAADLLDFSRAAVDGSHVRAMKGGNQTGRSPVDPGKDRQQAPCDRRGPRHPAGRHADRRQPQRRDPTDPADPGRPTDPRQARATTTAPRPRVRRSRLRPRQAPSPGARAGHHPGHRPPRLRDNSLCHLVATTPQYVAWSPGSKTADTDMLVSTFR
jgi:transposase